MTIADGSSIANAVFRPTLRIGSEALEIAIALALRALPHETGGILVGWHEDKTVVVTGMLAVPGQEAGERYYARTQSQAQKVLDVHRRTCTDERVGYVGEWHSHPAPQPPSGVDYNVLTELARDTNQQVALVVLAVDADSRVTPFGTTAQHTGHELTITDVTVESRDHA